MGTASADGLINRRIFAHEDFEAECRPKTCRAIGTRAGDYLSPLSAAERPSFTNNISLLGWELWRTGTPRVWHGHLAEPLLLHHRVVEGRRAGEGQTSCLE